MLLPPRPNSPPPAIEDAFDAAAIARRGFRALAESVELEHADGAVPPPRAGTGDEGGVSAQRSADPMSRIMSARPPVHRPTVAGASAAKANATTTSSGTGTSAPRALASARMRLAVSMRSVERPGTCPRVASGGDEGVGNAATDDELVHLADQVLQQGVSLVGHLRAGDDGQQRRAGCLQRARDGVELGHQRSAAGHPDRLDRPVGGGGRGAPCRRRPSRTRHAQRGVLRRQRRVVAALADVHAAVLQQHQFPGATATPSR